MPEICHHTGAALNVGCFLARKVLTAAAFGAFAWASVAQAAVSQPTYPKSDLLLVTTVINATNPYMASWIQGSKDLAGKLGVPVEVVQSNGSSQTELAGIQAQAAKGKKVVLVMNPVAASNVPACSPDDQFQRRL